MKNTMYDILAYQGRVAGSLILFRLRLPHPAHPMSLNGDQRSELYNRWIYSIWKQLLSWQAIYRLLELVMTQSIRQIDDSNLHSPLSLVSKKIVRFESL